MSETTNNPPRPEDVEDAVISEHRGISLIWLLPVLAALVGAWLIWRSLSEAGIVATIEFDDGAGIVPGKTEVRYEGIAIGNVTQMELQADLSGVVVTVEFNHSAEPLLREDTKIWLVKPQVSLAGITGLETLVSGNYITLRPGKGEASNRFKALSDPPAQDETEKGLRLQLRAEDLGSLSAGAPVYYKKVEVGHIESYDLDEQGKGVLINTFIAPEYRHLINGNSRFWNASGISFSGGIRGFEVNTGPLMSILRGGIMFDSPGPGPEVKNNDEFRLFPDYRSAAAGIELTLILPDPEGIQAGQTEIRYRGFKVGRIRRLELDTEDPRRGAIAKVVMSPQAEPYLLSDSHFWVVRPRLSAEGVSGLDALLGGAYIEMELGINGKPQSQFTLLDQPPPVSADAPGLQLWLRTDSLGSLTRGASVYYRRIRVGSVQDFTLRQDGAAIDVQLHIQPEYAHLVTDRARFWNASGIEISGGLDGIRVHAESLAAILAGGVAFSTQPGGKSVSDGHRFNLYGNRDAAEQRGVFIDIYLRSGDGLKVGSPLKYQGVKVGEVIDLQLTSDLGGVVAQVRLDQQSEAIAREGSRFWVVSPALGLLETRNLDTLIGGSYLSVAPGHGGPALQFAGLPEAPLGGADSGLPIVLETADLGSIRRGLKVFYRGIEVGVVTGTRLANPADKVEIQLRIAPRYAPLVHEHSRFFNLSGIHVDAGLFRGLKIDSASLETLVAGGIGFATPEGTAAGSPAHANQRFTLHAQAAPAWLQWQPGLRLDGPAPVAAE